MSEFNWKVLRGPTLQYKPDIVEANLNGYTRRFAYGLNNSPQEWSGLRFSEDLDKLMEFLKSKRSVTAFTLTPFKPTPILAL